jgi:hypothetical protein
MMWSSIVGALLGKVAPKVADYYMEKQKLKQEVELEVLRGKAEYERAKTQRASESEGRDHEWEIESIRNSGWKDELVIIVLSIPLVAVFVPGLEPYIANGFEHLASTPEWYRWLIMMIYAATFGIRVWRRKL